MRTQADRDLDLATGRELERKDAEIDRLRHDIERHLQIATEQQAEIERLREIETAARDLVALWQEQKIAGLPRAERNTAIEGVRSKLIELLGRTDPEGTQ